jgi:hypothetical protein
MWDLGDEPLVSMIVTLVKTTDFDEDICCELAIRGRTSINNVWKKENNFFIYVKKL